MIAILPWSPVGKSTFNRDDYCIYANSLWFSGSLPYTDWISRSSVWITKSLRVKGKLFILAFFMGTFWNIWYLYLMIKLGISWISSFVGLLFVNLLWSPSHNALSEAHTKLTTTLALCSHLQNLEIFLWICDFKNILQSPLIIMVLEHYLLSMTWFHVQYAQIQKSQFVKVYFESCNWIYSLAWNVKWYLVFICYETWFSTFINWQHTPWKKYQVLSYHATCMEHIFKWHHDYCVAEHFFTMISSPL